MNKSELIGAFAEKNNVSLKEAGASVASVFEIIAETVSKGEDVLISDFGAFKVAERKERMGRNPQTGSEIKIAASKVVKFTAYTVLKTSVNK